MNFAIIKDVAHTDSKNYVTLADVTYDLDSLFREGALEWFRFGLQVIPIVPRTKSPVVKWDSWLDGLSVEKIQRHWKAHPDHEVGCILNEGLIVFDADSDASVQSLVLIENDAGIRPNLVIKTTKGEHHYFRRATGTCAKSDAHSTEMHPSRIDVKTGRALVVLPPSFGKSVVFGREGGLGDLTEATQELIDSVFDHNGRPKPRQEVVRPVIRPETTDPGLRKVRALLKHIDPDVGYQDWFNCGAAIFYESSGSDEGLDVFDEWSSKGKKYKNRNEIEIKWRSFRSDIPHPITIATIKKMVADSGGDWIAMCDSAEQQFEVCDNEVVKVAQGQAANEIAQNVLDQFSLRGMSDEIEKRAVAEVPVLGQMALQGQVTVWYAAPNTGKTLLAMSLLIDAIQAGRVDPSKVYYVNMDDNTNGLLAKLRIAEEYGFNMIAETWLQFSADKLIGLISELSVNDGAQSLIIIVDTLKKVTDLMDKAKCSRFTQVIRGFVLRGGTVVALAHTNKNPGRDGKPVYGGVSDILNDVDCSYTIRALPCEPGATEKVIEFENIKRRGGVVQNAAYSYSIEAKMSYGALVLSVQPVEEKKVASIKQAEAIRSDAELIEAVKVCINDGFVTKMKLASAVAAGAGVSRKAALAVIEKYTGEDPSRHRWKFSVRDRGAKVFALLDSDTTGSNPENSEN